ncbi:energy transducer TonB [Sporomusa malonica]|uniref:Outer membrane transport energization protein TonB n=1 Tax=Sporomusa malonica TaxID=112901 RepID=A0A1W1ZPF0_9FIRM|nr:energy transducer TonB [Sporomusa malonica]SMC49988.1 outer membrane transport energization protein TonB [Sporomusa malonica]
MTYAYHWRKAMAISLCLHVFLVIAAGHLIAGLASPLPVPTEVLLEMDLVSDPAEHSGNSTAVAEPPPPLDAPKPAPTEISPILPPQPETPVTEPEPVVTTNELTMTKAETQAATPTPNQSASSGIPPAVPTAGGSTRSAISAPGILAKVDPVYPAAARQAGLEGTVVLRIEILTNGRPGEIAVARSTGHSVLDDAAITAVGKWRFVPAKDRTSGRTVACTTTLPVSFRLH